MLLQVLSAVATVIVCFLSLCLLFTYKRITTGHIMSKYKSAPYENTAWCVQSVLPLIVSIAFAMLSQTRILYSIAFYVGAIWLGGWLYIWGTLAYLNSDFAINRRKNKERST
jgi:hypothetical protein